MKNVVSIFLLFILLKSALIPLSHAQTIYLTEEDIKLFGLDKEKVCGNNSAISLTDSVSVQGEDVDSPALKKRMEEDPEFAKKLIQDAYGFQKAMKEIRQYTPELLTENEVALVARIIEAFEKFVSQHHPSIKIDQASQSKIKPLWGDEKDDLKEYFQAKDDRKQELYKLTKINLLRTIVDWAEASEILHCEVIYRYKFTATYDENADFEYDSDRIQMEDFIATAWQNELGLINSNFAGIFAVHQQLGEDVVSKEEFDIMAYATKIKLAALKARFPEITDEIIQRNYMEKIRFLPDYKNSEKTLAYRRRMEESTLYNTVIAVEINQGVNIADIELYPWDQ